MRLSRWIGLLLCGLLAATAHAQGYKWVDKNGHTQYGDTPPPGVNATPLGPPPPPISSTPSPAPTGDVKEGAPAVKKGPLTPAEQELEFRRRIKEAQEAAAKADKEQQQAREKEENCKHAQAALRTLESGERVMTVDQKGERYYISDQQRAAETARAQEQVRQWCN